MENLDSVTFPVKVRMNTVYKEDKIYGIYVISQLATQML